MRDSARRPYGCLGHYERIEDVYNLTGRARKDCRKNIAGFVQAAVNVNPSPWRPR